MKKIIIEGNNLLEGTIRISGAKNGAVALVPAAILASSESTICNVPEISDIDSLVDILECLNVDVRRASESLVIDPSNIKNCVIEEEYSKKLRASYYFMGALLAKFKRVEMALPGGCSIGERPINLHLKGFEALGAKVTNNGNMYVVEADELKGADIYLDIASVGATINIMMASVLATGTTVIDNAAKEPEIVNIATFLNSMGAKITGAGTSTIRIQGVSELKGCFTEVIPDRIEAGTYLIIGALCGNNFKVSNVIPEHLDALISKLREMGCPIKTDFDSVTLSKTTMKSTNIKTLVYPGFPTDLQQPFSVLLTQANGKSKVVETIWENRFMHVPYLEKMGADISVKGQTAAIIGPTKLHADVVKATDLRAGAAMIAAGLTADGKTTIENVEHILRGYESIVDKLKNVGAKIELIDV